MTHHDSWLTYIHHDMSATARRWFLPLSAGIAGLTQREILGDDLHLRRTSITHIIQTINHFLNMDLIWFDDILESFDDMLEQI
jgi:hypothetical protein